MPVEIWRGASALDASADIVLLASTNSRNKKTGNMIQTWILRQDMPPGDAVRAGVDDAICGNCPVRRNGCYVQVDRAPRNVWNAWRQGKAARPGAHYFINTLVRCGSYGDPAAVPYEVWEPIIKASLGHTSYTHQWRTCDPRFARFSMASVESLEQAAEARALGYRAYRTGHKGELRAKGEALCPASDEAGNKLTCAQCLACNGAGHHGDVFIPVHGAVSKINFYEQILAQPQTEAA